MWVATTGWGDSQQMRPPTRQRPLHQRDERLLLPVIGVELADERPVQPETCDAEVGSAVADHTKLRAADGQLEARRVTPTWMARSIRSSAIAFPSRIHGSTRAPS